jgi:hypothetical protein
MTRTTSGARSGFWNFSERALMIFAIAAAALGFFSCTAIAVHYRDPDWVARGGALIAATGALTLFAQWTGDRTIEDRRLAIDHLLDDIRARAADQHQDLSFEIHQARLAAMSATSGARLPVVSVSAALLFIGTILHGFGDKIAELLCSL